MRIADSRTRLVALYDARQDRADEDHACHAENVLEPGGGAERARRQRGFHLPGNATSISRPIGVQAERWPRSMAGSGMSAE